MAVTNYTGLQISNPQVGIQITKVTDTSADWGSLSNSTYFYDKATALVYFKDGTGSVLSLFSSSGGSSGKFGISDSSGVYTYYSTLQAAITAASAGQVVEMFADVTDSTSTAVTLKAGVTIQGNGHTYTHTSTIGNTFDVATNGNYYFNNIIIKRTNTTPTGSFIFNGTNYYINPLMIFQSTYIEYTYTSSVGATPFFGTSLVMNFTIDGLRGLSNGSGNMVESSATIKNCNLENTGTGNCIGIGYNGTVENCFCKTDSGYGIGCNNTAIVRNCNVVSNTGKGIVQGSIYLSSAFSNTNYAFDSCAIYNCTGQSVSGTAFYACVARNCSGYTTTGSAFTPYFTTGTASNCTLYSSSSIPANSGFSSIYENCTIICDWNNASGHAVSTGAAYGVVPDVSNCKLVVANSSANCINGSAITVKYSNNTYKGATTPVNAGITQGVTNIQDNQGNILM